jgi:hypothetical protein
MAFNDPRNINSLLAREIFFKDKGNRPISTNRALLARGDGGTYWADTTISTQTAFNNFRASTIEFAASNVENTLWFESGSGIEFYSTINSNTGQPMVYIAATGPDTLVVPGQTPVNLNNLPNDITLGNTLTFVGAGDIAIYTSGATVIFDANNASTFSSILALQSTTLGIQSTTEQLQSTSEGLIDNLSSLTGVVDTLLLSSAVSTFWSTLMYTKNVAETTSTFVFSTFNISSGTLNITYPNVFISSLTVDKLNVPLISTFSTIFWSSAFGTNTKTSSLFVSTIGGNAGPIITFDNNNNRIGINLSNTMPRATVDVNGIVYANNFVTASDRRLKTAFEPLLPQGMLDAYRFSWISNGSSDIGFIADEVEAVAPECVTLGGDGYKAVNYAKLVPYCFAVIKDLAARVAALESKTQ